jgi:glycogen debranching enzyme
VEINALWYNALCLLRDWLRTDGQSAKAEAIEKHAQQARDSFQKRFWYAKGNYLYDVVDGENGDDPSLRPNQVFAISLDFPILSQNRWAPVIQCLERNLLTPVGLRSLAPGEQDYKAQYYGNLRARDAAYHQGTVWPWLIGPYIDAWLRLHPDQIEHAETLLRTLEDRLAENGIGTIGEIFDAEAPYTHRGCVAQAWSVSEVLRSMVKLTALKKRNELTKVA